MSNDWLNSYDEVVVFGGVLLTGGEFTDAEELQYFYEKPHKYTDMYESWVAADKPDEVGEIADWLTGYHGEEA
jgi:hypothetical protein